jgi:uncharacterized short protein YbdD (DUF466 family)
MPSESSTRIARLHTAFAQCRRALRALCGLPDYEAYLAHCRLHHPERTPPSRAEFYRERETARYGRGRSRCC